MFLFFLSIGTSKEGNDVVAFQNLGITQHKALHQLNLQSGYQYYATLKGEWIKCFKGCHVRDHMIDGFLQLPI